MEKESGHELASVSIYGTTIVSKHAAMTGRPMAHPTDPPGEADCPRDFMIDAMITG
jgi:hypothetical protein